MRNSPEKIFKQTAQDLFNTPNGITVLAYLNDSYVKSSALGESPELTYYKLGQKELIQSLIAVLNEPDKLDDIQVYDTVSEDI